MVLSSVRFTPAPTSSRKTILASTIIVRPSSSSFFWPPDRLPANSSATWGISRKSITSSARARTSASRARTRPGRNHASQSASPGCSGGTIIRFSRTLSVPNSWAIWKVRSNPLWNRSCGGRPVISSPSRKTWPDVGV